MVSPRVVRNAEGRLQRVQPSGIRLDPATMEVFAWVGVALAWAQALERTLAAYVVLAGTSAEGRTRDQFRISIETLSRKTLGTLVNQLRRHVEADELTVLDNLGDVVERRNHLAHHFFRSPSRRALLATDSGRAGMIAEAQDDMTEFRVWTSRITPFVLRHAFRLGQRSEHLREHAAWLQTVEAEVKEDELRGEARRAVAADPGLALQIAEIMEAIEGRQRV